MVGAKIDQFLLAHRTHHGQESNMLKLKPHSTQRSRHRSGAMPPRPGQIGSAARSLQALPPHRANGALVKPSAKGSQIAGGAFLNLARSFAGHGFSAVGTDAVGCPGTRCE